jgi:diketogulonate reductase-like aldo/keto reductase
MTAEAVTADGRARVLADGNEIPLLGLGVWQIPNGRETENAVRWALELGYRLIDTAQGHGNEESVGRALDALDERAALSARGDNAARTVQARPRTPMRRGS